MKPIFKHKTILLLIILASIVSCEKWIDPDLSIDPDSPKDITMGMLLSASQVQTAYTLGGFDVAGITSIWMRYLLGLSQQAKKIDDFVLLEKDVNSAWNNIYGALYDIKQIKIKSKEAGKESPYYEGIAKVMAAQLFGTATQLWGDIPFSEALYGDSILDPKYDSQEDIYYGIQTMLNEAIVAFNTPKKDNYYEIEGDLIFNGDIEKWKKTAHSLKLRYYLHLTKVNPNYYDTIVTLYNADSLVYFTSHEDDFQLFFGERENEKNPLYQFDEQRSYYCVSNAFIDSILNSKELKNRSSFTADNIWKVYLIGVENEPFGGRYYGEANSPVNFMSHAELQFILAEARYKTNDSLSALFSLKNGIKSFRKKISQGIEIQIDHDAWITEYEFQVFSDPVNLNIEIMTQKYIAMFLNPESFVDYRRTGIPTNIESSARILPRRFPYPSEERLYNVNIPATSSIYARNWMDPE